MNNPSPVLPIIERPPKPVFDWKNRLAVAVRIGLLLLIVVGIRSREAVNHPVTGERFLVSLEDARLVVPDAGKLKEDTAAGQSVFDTQGKKLARITTTIPDSNRVIGYRGPSHCVLRTDDDGTIQKVALLKSRDTPEHIRIVQEDEAFWKQFEGLTPGAVTSVSEIDAVSGATLTSLAIAEGIGLRMGQRPGSLKFPDRVSPDEISSLWPDLPAGWKSVRSDTHVEVIHPNGDVIGIVIRTGSLVDSIIGYQGPTELLIAVDADGQVVDIQKRSSWDNEPYAGYLDDEPGFWRAFRGSSLQAIATADLKELEVEGVSGATMTSVAAAETVVAAASEWNRRKQQEDSARIRGEVHWTANDIGSVVVVLLGCLIALTRLRSVRWLRFLWNVVLIAYFGLVTGNLISLVLVFGWSASGIAYLLAPGLTFVVAVSFLSPAVSKRNVYCSHLCPHGAAQQLLRHKLSKRYRFPRNWMTLLTWGPGILLVAATLSVLAGFPLNLAAIEPFNAYIWYVSGVSSLVLAVASLIWSSFEPMAWCRYGCGTGRLLDYVRLSGSSAQLGFADFVVLILAAASLLA